MSTVQETIDTLYKKHFGKMVSSLLYSLRGIDAETAEDIVQDCFSTALTHWTEHGVPLNAAGWIYKVCRNKALTKIKRDSRQVSLDNDISLAAVETRFSESILDDQPLILLFACAHPDLAPKVQVVLTLKYVANLKVEAIARSLAMSVDGVDKLLLRARQKMKNDELLLDEPDTASMRQRLHIVHKIIYLIFNEGYKTSWGNQLVREELCEEALIMNKTLLDSPLHTNDTKALQALMLFAAARFKSRFGANGELLDWEQQDRTRWNHELIALGQQLLHASRQGELSTYHLEAGISLLHCTARQFRDTDWQTIAGLYARLAQRHLNPFVDLNFAIALYYAEQKERAFLLLHQLQRQPFFYHYYLLNATLGKLYLKEGDYATARNFLSKAITQTASRLEKNLIQKMLNECT